MNNLGEKKLTYFAVKIFVELSTPTSLQRGLEMFMTSTPQPFTVETFVCAESSRYLRTTVMQRTIMILMLKNRSQSDSCPQAWEPAQVYLNLSAQELLQLTAYGLATSLLSH